MEPRIESMLAARLHLAPQLIGERIFFISNLSGHLSLYAMHYGGSVPEPLLPPQVAMPNPEFVGGLPYCVLPRLGKILVMLDQDGDENYQPRTIPLDGGFPETTFSDQFHDCRVHLMDCDVERNIAYLSAERSDQPVQDVFKAHLVTGELVKLYETGWEVIPGGYSEDHRRLLMVEGYTLGDHVLYLFDGGARKVLLGRLVGDRRDGEVIPLNGVGSACWTPGGNAALVTCALFEDTYSLGVLDLSRPGEVQPVEMTGMIHTGNGELAGLKPLRGTHYGVSFNIDGCSWLYDGVYNEDKRQMTLKYAVVGEGDLSGGALKNYHYDKSSDRFILSFSTATGPTQIYTVEGKERETIVMHTEERFLGVSEEDLSPGEDASFVSHDGLRVSARLYLPAAGLGFSGPRPVVVYIHGGPQEQERPDFSWFSMPLIQFLTLRGFAVFVPNVRGSTGYGLDYASRVDRDWGGQDRLDHVHALTKVLLKDKRLDVKRAAVVGRSYGGYMTLMLAGQRPELWSAACDMFGPYDLLTFSERIPETWKPYFKVAIGDPDTADGRATLAACSPKTYIDALACPLLVIQGRNDPRVVAKESEELAADLKKKGREIELLVFEDEGHDMLKFANRVACYNAIADFFAKHLKP